MGRLLQESFIRVQQDIQFAFTEAPEIGRWFPHVQLGIFQFDHGRRLRKTVENLLSDIEPVSSPGVRRDIATTTVKLLAIENVRRREVSERRVNDLMENLRQDKIDDAAMRGGRREMVDKQWEIAARLAGVLTNTTAGAQQLSSLKELLIDATALEVDSLS